MEYAAARPPFDPARVTGWTATLALNLIALALLARGADGDWSTPTDIDPAGLDTIWIVPVVPPPPAPPEAIQPLRSATPPTSARRSPTAPVSPVATPIDRPASPPDPGLAPTPAESPAPSGFDGQTASAGGGDGLAYLDAPAPRYPPDALRRGWEGTVWLRVLVDEAGRPVEVEIERSSGHGSLDRAARDQVLRRWRFQPALREGRAVPAWGRVPIRFSLGAG